MDDGLILFLCFYFKNINLMRLFICNFLFIFSFFIYGCWDVLYWKEVFDNGCSIFWIVFKYWKCICIRFIFFVF